MPRTTLLRKQVTQTGTIQPHAGPTAPEGHLLCDGSIVNIADYPKLYAVIGTSWGHGNEVSPGVSDGLTFHLPDLRGRFLRGSTENMDPVEAALRDPDYASRAPSNLGGNEEGVGSVQSHQLDSHRHTHTRAVYNAAVNFGDAYSQWGFSYQTVNTGYTGGNETRPLNAYVVYIIKAV